MCIDTRDPPVLEVPLMYLSTDIFLQANSTWRCCIFIFLQTNCTLKSLNLAYNGFSNDGAVALGEAIRANNTLLELDIR